MYAPLTQTTAYILLGISFQQMIGNIVQSRSTRTPIDQPGRQKMAAGIPSGNVKLIIYSGQI